MYRIAILEKDKAYLDRLMDFLEGRHRDSFEIHTVSASGADWDDVSLEELDMETVDYAALFLGDGVDTQDPIPADVMIGYLTESSDEPGEEWIDKYQSMEQIYRQMIRLCEQSRKDRDRSGDGQAVPESDAGMPGGQSSDAPDSVEKGFRAEDISEDGEIYRVWHIDDGKIDKFAVRMLTKNQIEGLAQCVHVDGELRFKITGMERLDQYVRKAGPGAKQQLFRILGGMCRTALGLEEYMLTSDGLVLDLDEIFVDAGTGAAVLLYAPFAGRSEKGAGQFLEELMELCRGLIEAVGRREAQEDAAPQVMQEARKPKEDGQEARDRAEMPYMIRKKNGEKIRIDRNVFKIGKDASCVDYCILDNPTVSRDHAHIVRKQDGFYLFDKGSLNHTFVDGRKLRPGEAWRLENGCLIQLADEVFKFIIRPKKHFGQ